MASSTAVTLIFFFIFISLSAGTVTGLRFSKIYAFGNSYTDTGNTKSGPDGPVGFNHVSSLPYGMTFFHKPTNRYSDGRLVIDFITEHLSLPYLPPYVNRDKADTSHGINFAVAGSTATDQSFFVKQNVTFYVPNASINVQLGWFKLFLESHGCHRQVINNKVIMSKECSGLMDNALFWVGEIGANDYAYTIGSSVAKETIQNLAVSRVTGVLTELLEMGAKHVVVEGLPPTGCLPLALTLAPTDDRDDMACVASANKQSYIHNTQLQANLQYLKKQYPQSMISYADYFAAYRTVVMNTNKYGFKEPFKCCCGPSGEPYNFEFFVPCGSPSASKACKHPSQHINWDGVHLTEGMYKVVSEMFIHGGYMHPPFF
ncbi:hypothetical protein MKW94_005563 [Papaver nudicaule]|uniref:Uncharacterized protein n=1 Tax=Papaver nudicaule TaxID=74823 RepID=A0AA41UZS7_PAPNU|nr:hypothetical protein [Papaver nudicaule]